jgi:hypothetical protein
MALPKPGAASTDPTAAGRAIRAMASDSEVTGAQP